MKWYIAANGNNINRTTNKRIIERSSKEALGSYMQVFSTSYHFTAAQPLNI